MKTTQAIPLNCELFIQKTLPRSRSTRNLTYLHPILDVNYLKKKRVTVPLGNLQKELAHYQWRSKTEFPIVKVTSFPIVQACNKEVVLEVEYDDMELLLIELRDLPLFKTLYLLKEALIGFERLFDRFGSFMVTPKMVGINRQHQCKVWLNQNFSSNSFKTFQLDQRYFLVSIYHLFETRCVKLKNSFVFFHQLSYQRTFSAALNFIEYYTRQHHIIIPNVLRIVKVKDEILTKNQYKNVFDPNKTLPLVPRFLNHTFRNDSMIDQSIFFYPTKCVSVVRPTIYDQDLKELKLSGETAADNYTSNSSKTITPSKSIFNQENILSQISQTVPQKKSNKNHKQKNSQVVKSQFIQFKPRAERHSRCCKKADEILSASKTKNAVRKMVSLQEISNFSVNQEDEEMTEKQIGSLFELNNWQQKIGSLFNQGAQMRQSIHQGKQPAWSNQKSIRKLNLLDNLGKNVFESVLGGEYKKNG